MHGTPVTLPAAYAQNTLDDTAPHSSLSSTASYKIYIASRRNLVCTMYSSTLSSKLKSFQAVRTKKIKGLFALLVWKMEGSFDFFKNLDTEEMQYHSCVCAFLGIAEPQNWFNPDVGLGCISLGVYLVKVPF